jgi:(p)ppGpp synthase/HD superfamily hydrolase
MMNMYLRAGRVLPVAIKTANAYHASILDDNGVPYIFHPLRVATAAQACGLDEDAQSVAAVHDVVEDTECTLDDLRQLGLPEAVINGVDAMTRRSGKLAVDGIDETYDEFIKRTAKNPISRKVKALDIADNLRPERKRPGHDFKLLARYLRALSVLTVAWVDNGEQEFFRKFREYHTWV